MKKTKYFSLSLILCLLNIVACQERENVYPDGAAILNDKSIPSGYENNPVDQFVGTNNIDLTVPQPAPPPPTELGNKMKISTTFNTIVLTDHELVQGKMVTELSGLWDKENMTGPVSGEFVINLDNENQWKGMVHGKRHKIDESTWRWTAKYIGKGYGEALSGMKIIFNEEIISHMPMPPDPSLLEPVINGKVITK